MPLLESVTLRGRRDSATLHVDVIRADPTRTTATLAWGYRCVATLTGWTISRKKDALTDVQEWRLLARVLGTVDPFFLRQRPLLLTVPRPGGFWIWPVRHLTFLDPHVSATLGPPEQ
jgi:hypothetical protein